MSIGIEQAMVVMSVEDDNSLTNSELIVGAARTKAKKNEAGWQRESATPSRHFLLLSAETLPLAVETMPSPPLEGEWRIDGGTGQGSSGAVPDNALTNSLPFSSEQR